MLRTSVFVVMSSTDFNVLSELNPKTNDTKALIPALITLFEKFEDNFVRMFDMKLENMRQDYLKEVRIRDDKILELESKIVCFEKRIVKLEDRIEENEQYERRDALVISGSTIPPEKKDENCNQLVKTLLKNNLNIEVQTDEISVTHRLSAKPNDQRVEKRSIIVKFCKRSTKVDVLSSARRKKADNFYVNESLTPIAQTISYVLRKAKRQHPDKISGSTTFDGKNFVWVKPPNPNAPGAKCSRHSVTNYERLSHFCARVLETPLTSFIEQWSH